MPLLGVVAFAGAGFGLVYATSHDDLPPWLQYGIMGVVILAIVTKQLVPGWTIKDMEARLTKLEADNERLLDLLLETQRQVLPALTEGTAALRDAQREHRRDFKER